MVAKSLLYNGCIVEDKNGVRRMFISQFGVSKEDLFVSRAGFMRVKDYNNHLVCTSNECFSIVAIYDPLPGGGFEGIERKDLTKIWDNGKIEITMSEIAAKFGYPVDRIAIVK